MDYGYILNEWKEQNHENLFRLILENENSDLNQTGGNWSSEMKKLRELIKNTIPIQSIEFTKQNLEKLGNCVTTPIKTVYFENIGPESLFHKIKRNQGVNGDIDRRLLLDAIPKVLSNPIFIIEHSPTAKEHYSDIRHLYFRKVDLQGNDFILVFIVSLEKSKTKLLSFYKITDIYRLISEGDIIVYEGGQQTKVKLSKG